MKKKIFALIISICLAAGLLAACSGGGSQSETTQGNDETTNAAVEETTQASDDGQSAADDSREPITLTFAHYQGAGSMMDTVINDWCKEITDASDGLITFEMYGGGALGAAADHYDMVRTGTCDIAYSFFGVHTGVFKVMETLTLPMLGFATGEEAGQAFWDFYENYDFAKEELGNVHTLSIASAPPHIILTRGYAVNSPEDLKQASLRVPGGPINDFMVTLGASTTSIPISDVYENVQKDILNGGVLAEDCLVSWNLRELLTDVNETPLQSAIYYTWMNNDTWNSLPDWAKDIFDEYGGMYASRMMSAEMDEIQAQMVDDVKANDNINFNEFSDEVIEELNQVADDVTQSWIKELDDAGYDGQAIVDAVYEVRDKYATAN